MNQSFLIRALSFSIILIFITNYIDAQQSFGQKYSRNEFDTLKVLNELSLSHADSILLHIEELNKMDYCNCKDMLMSYSISNNLIYIFHTYMAFYSDAEKLKRYGSARILYKNNIRNSPIYKLSLDSLEIRTGSLSGVVLNQSIIDYNNDGYKDLHLSFSANTSGRSGNNIFFRFNPSNKKFEVDSELIEKFRNDEIYIDETDKVISTGGRSGIIGFSGTDYKLNEKGEYSKIAEYESANHIDTTFIFKKILINGEWIIMSTDTITY